LAQFKGTVFASTRDFTERRFGASAFGQILEALPVADREILSSVTHMGWYPVEPILRYHHALDRMFGRGDLELCTEAGRYSAEWAINSILKVYVRFRSPHWLVDRATSVWRHYHDTGHWEVGPKELNTLSGKISDFAVRDLAFCARLRGWLAGAARLTGGRDPKVTELCCAVKGARYCEFECRWH
jgi:hypothetical protein